MGSLLLTSTLTRLMDEGQGGGNSSPDSVGERPVYQQVIWQSTNQSRIQRGVIKASLVWVLLLLAGACSAVIALTAEFAREFAESRSVLV